MHLHKFVAVGSGIILFLTSLVGWFAYGNARIEKENRHERILLINNLNKHDCLEIENLKQGFREDAIRDYNRLNETLRLLKLERTPQIEKRALADRDRKLKKYAAKSCPREEIPID